MVTNCERCNRRISSHQSQRTATGYACKRNTACARVWRQTHPAPKVEHTTDCGDCGATAPYAVMTWVQSFVYVCGLCEPANVALAF